MGLLEDIQNDAADFVSNTADFAVEMTFTDNAYNNATVNGIYSKHHTKVDTEGNSVNSLTNSICVSESKLLAAGYEVRDPDTGEVDMTGHLVTFKDSTGTSQQYKINQALPDETVGLLTFFLSEYAAN